MSTIQPQSTSILKHLGNFLRHPQARAIAILFLAHGFMISSWFAQVPTVKTRLALNDSELGNVLLGLPLGIFLMNIIAGWLLEKLGVWNSIFLGFLGYGISIIFLFVANDFWILFFNLVITGWTVGILVVGSNTLAARIEKTEGIFIMSSCHAGFSFGAMVGAAISSLVIGRELSPLYQIITISLIFFVLIISHKKHFQSIPTNLNEDGGSTFGWPNRELLLLIFIGLAFTISEGVVVDWSAVYIRDVLKATPETAALGYSACAFTMMMMRFFGDLLLPRFGVQKILLYGGVITFIGILFIALSQTPLIGILGFAIIGIGIALSMPMLMTLAASTKGFSDGAGVGIFATFAFMGFIIEPPMVGWVAEQSDLRWALGMVGGIVLLGAILALRIKRN